MIVCIICCSSDKFTSRKSCVKWKIKHRVFFLVVVVKNSLHENNLQSCRSSNKTQTLLYWRIWQSPRNSLSDNCQSDTMKGGDQTKDTVMNEFLEVSDGSND